MPATMCGMKAKIIIRTYKTYFAFRLNKNFADAATICTLTLSYINTWKVVISINLNVSIIK